MAVIHLGMGILVASLGAQSQTWVKRYDARCGLGPTDEFGHTTIDFDIGEPTKGRFFLYYELDGFQHNHFRFAGSLSESQMLGKYVEDPSECSPLAKVDNNTIFPCGLRSYYFFNDTYETDSGAFSETPIAWKGEVGNLFKKPDDQYPLEQRFLQRYDAQHFEGETMNEHFVVWMRTAKDSRFRKLWAKSVIEELPRYVSFAVHCAYPWSIYDGPRRLVLMKVGGLGGKNLFITIVSFVLFALCGIFALTFQFMCCTCVADSERPVDLWADVLGIKPEPAPEPDEKIVHV
jgi:hypothetical protein